MKSRKKRKRDRRRQAEALTPGGGGDRLTPPRGGLLGFDALSRADMALVRRAIHRRWPVAAAERKRILARLFTAMENPHARHKVAACRTIVLADGANLKAEHAGQPPPYPLR